MTKWKHWILRHLTRSVKLKPWPGGHEALFVATSDCLPSHPTKDRRATTAVSLGVDLETAGHQALTIGMPH